MTKRHILQAELGGQLEGEVEEMARGRGVSKSDAVRELLRRGLKQYHQESELLRRLREARAV